MGPLVAALPSIISAIENIADDLITTDKERAQMLLAEKELDMRPLMGQIEINKAEAKSDSVFVAGWRPAIGWVCGLAFGYVAVLEPLLRFFSTVIFGYEGSFPVIDTNITMQVLLGMLGFGALRSVEKVKGIK